MQPVATSSEARPSLTVGPVHSDVRPSPVLGPKAYQPPPSAPLQRVRALLRLRPLPTLPSTANRVAFRDQVAGAVLEFLFKLLFAPEYASVRRGLHTTHNLCL
ncbi:hypothetical protein H633G_11419 [Metarhizium anisopliae BRIP 53284]|nr:hypothetical protein H633G_11419 [Metarhizium anisopliae BRIP 53284]